MRSGNHEAARRIRARIVDEPVAEGEDPPRVVEAHRHVVLLLALLGRGQHVLEPVLEPAHGPPEPPREERDEHVLGIDDELGAEASADVGRDHAHLMRRQVEEIADELPDLVRHLGGGPHREQAEGRVPVRDEPARLHGLAAAPPDAELDLDDARRGAQRGLDVSARETHPPGQIVRHVVVHGRRPRGQRLSRGQRLVLHVYQLARVFGRVPAVPHHHRHHLADEARAAVGKHGKVVAAQLGVRRHDGKRPAGRVQIHKAHDVHHPGVLARARGVHPHDAGVGVGAPHERGVEHSGQSDVAHVLPAPGQEPRVFLAEVAIADELHRGAPAARRAAAASSPACTMFW